MGYKKLSKLVVELLGRIQKKLEIPKQLLKDIEHELF
jgi:hypothetical protein